LGYGGFRPSFVGGSSAREGRGVMCKASSEERLGITVAAHRGEKRGNARQKGGTVIARGSGKKKTLGGRGVLRGMDRKTKVGPVCGGVGEEKEDKG